jgi:hypothetical protein
MFTKPQLIKITANKVKIKTEGKRRSPILKPYKENTIPIEPMMMSLVNKFFFCIKKVMEAHPITALRSTSHKGIISVSLFD